VARAGHEDEQREVPVGERRNQQTERRVLDDGDGHRAEVPVREDQEVRHDHGAQRGGRPGLPN